MKFTGTFNIRKNGKILTVPYECHTRGGWKSPTSTYVFVDGKRITPYAFNKLGYEFTLDSLFQITYKPHLHKLVWESIIAGESCLKTGIDRNGDVYYIPIVLSKVHGMDY